MTSSSKNLEPYHNSAEALDEQKRQLRCINRRCSYNDTLINAVELVCTYYDVVYKPGKEVCTTCHTKCLKHYKHLEMKWKEGKCIMNTSFPSFDSHIINDVSSGEEEEEEEEKPKPSTSREGLFDDQDVKNSINSAIIHYFKKNKHLVEHQVKLCDEFINEEISQCLVGADSLDKLVSGLEDEMASLRNEILGLDQSILTSLEPVDIIVLEENTKREQEQVEMPKEAKRFKLDKSYEDDIITLDRTVCVVPANLPLEGPLEYPVVEDGQIIYAMWLTLNDPWYICKIQSRINEDYLRVVFENGEKIVTIKEIAYSTLNSVRFPIGCRVIAKFTDSDSKQVDEFYSGVVAETPKMLNNFRYLIVFDYGCDKYQQHQDIRLIACRTSKHAWKDVNKNSQDFVKSYLEKYPERPMVKSANQNFVRTKNQCQWQLANVLEVDASLDKLYFADLKHSEWVYRGSSHLLSISEKQSKSERGIELRQSGQAYLKKPFVKFTSVEEKPSRVLAKCVARKSTSKNSTTPGDESQKYNQNKYNATKVVNVILSTSIPNPIKYSKHKCSFLCVAWTAYDYDKTKTMNMLTIPLHFGFVRYVTTFQKTQKCILYKTPCGVTISNMKQMLEYLIVTKSAITIDQFDFNSWVKPFAEFQIIKNVNFLKDISEGKEFKGIPCVNIINSKLPPQIKYITTRQPMPGVNINVESDFLCGCDCTDNCQDKLKCVCWQMTIEGQNNLPDLYKDPNIGYNYRRLPERVITGIYECNKTCKCSSSCLNRVVQNPLSQKLQLFMTEKKGWGVQCLNDIPQGSFICIYAGYLLTEADANEGGKNYGDEYLAELDYIEVVEKVKENYESDAPCSDHDYEPETSQFDVRTSLKLRKHKKSKIKNGYKHVQVLSKLNAGDMKNNPEQPKSVREYFGNNESVYIIDSKISGNIGRFLNHSCSPNTFVQNVFVDTHDLRFPWVSFFALHYIQAGTELTWDYNYDVGSVPGKKMKCHCESAVCRRRLL